MMPHCLRFIVSGEKEDTLSVNLLKNSAEKATEAGFDVEWLQFKDINNDDFHSITGEDVVLVCESFEGAVFDRLKTFNCKIVGPLCLVYCLEMDKRLPTCTSTVLNIAMLDLVTCCTSIPAEERMVLKKYINEMGGEMVNDLTGRVTHLIAGEVGSKKYQVACEMGIKVMQTSWVLDCYEKNKYEYVNATDEAFDRHLCPCFKGITICVTGMSANVRQDIKRLTSENGGKYSGELNMRSCTHLLVKVAKGEKYNYARQWKIHCVSPQWFFDCIKAGHWIEEDAYTVKPGEHSVLDESRFLNTSKTTINATVQSDMDMSMASNRAAEVAGRWMQNREEKRNHESYIQSKSKEPLMSADDFKIKCFNTSKLNAEKTVFSVSDIFLDGCKIYLTGIPTDLKACLRRLINGAGAMRLSQLNESITHIILGDTLSKDVEDFLHQNIQKPHVISPEWLIDSCKAGKQLSEQDYSLIEENRQTTLPDVSSISYETKRKTSRTAVASKDHVPSFQVDDDFEDEVFLGQYLPQAESSRISFMVEKRTSDENNEVPKIKDFEKPEQAEAIAGSYEKETEGEKCESPTKEKLCNGRKFSIKYFDEEQQTQIKSLIEEFGGQISKTEAKSDHIIVPLTHEKKRRTAKKEATLCWLEQSLEKESMLSITSDSLFRPFYLPQDCLPLADCVLTVSQFSGIERQHLSLLAELLGAFVQENFVRNATGGMRANTHLLLMEATGAKYEAALKWNVICVSKEWLLACAAKRSMVQPEKYPLKNAYTEQVDERESTIGDQPTQDYQTTYNMISKVDLTFQNELEAEKIEENKAGRQAEITHENIEKAAQKVSGVENKTKNPMSAPNNPMSTPHGGRSVATPGSTFRPEVRLHSGKPFKPLFDMKATADSLKSPAIVFDKRRESRASNGESSVDFFNGALKKALKFTEESGPSTDKKKRESTAEKHMKNQSDALKSEDTTSNNDLLNGVVIAVSKKLANRRIELHNLASDLGADCRFVFDESCTHLIHQGKPTDSIAEVRQARSQGKIIVSEHWLTACLEESTRVPEKLYPCTYNPKMSIEVMPEKIRRESKVSASSSRLRERTLHAPSPSIIGNDTRSSIIGKLNGDTTLFCDSDFNSKLLEESKELDKLPIDDAGNDDKGTPKKSEPSNVGIKSPPAFLSDASSLDARIEFKRHMEEIMEATKGNKEGTKRTRRPLPARRLRSRQSSQRASSESSKSSNEKKPHHEVFVTHGIDPSQGDVITYDDPTGRMERERILAQFKAASPSQDIDQEFDPVKEIKTEPDCSKEQLVMYGRANISAMANRTIEEKEPSSTPQPPPINLQISRPIQAPDPVNLLAEEENTKNDADYSKTHRFLLTTMTPQEKIRYSALIEDLGGVLCDAQFFSLDCTHVIAGSANRNEKFLSSIATGKWVLHKSYLEASREAGYFVDEELHEWGSEADPSRLSLAARRWREKLASKRMESSSKGAFEGWNVLLSVVSSLQHGLKRTIEAGGGIVRSVNPPFNNVEGVTHAFVEKSRTDGIDFAALHSARALILRPDYIADYLIQDPCPLTRRYIIQEAKNLEEIEGSYVGETSISDPKKRKNEDVSTIQRSKRTKT